ncbi:SMI1/KNR4 family protein OS=Lysinibacillus sphaericus OX=1421 GN=LS41612_13385 PE=4 SV=1 [Lysinibacillus sphaericus]
MILNFKSTPLITKTTRNIDAPEINTYFQLYTFETN